MNKIGKATGTKRSVILAAAMVAAVAALPISASAKTCTWTGGGDGVSFAVASNWDNGAPEAGDTVVFRPSGDLYVAISAHTVGLGELRFESGNTFFGVAAAKCNLNFDVSSGIYVAEDATATISNRVAGVAAHAQATISGGGSLTFYSDQVDNVGYFDLLDIMGGTRVTYGRTGEWRALVTRVRTGSSLSFVAFGKNTKSLYGHEKWPSLVIDDGGVVDLFNSTKSTFGSISGEGTLRIGNTCSFTLALDSGSASFGGKTEFYSNGKLTVTVSPEETDKTFTLSSERAFAGVDVNDGGALRFAPGCDAYVLKSYKSTVEAGLSIANTSGGPCALYGGWESNTADPVSVLPCRAGLKLNYDASGGSVAVGGSSLCIDGSDTGMPDISVSAGGTLVMHASNTIENLAYIFRSSATAENPAVLAFDGGALRISLAGNPTGLVRPLGTALTGSNLVVRVGSGGMRMSVCDEGALVYRSLRLFSPFVSSATPDGGFVRETGLGIFNFASPLSISGPFQSWDGIVEINPGIASEIASAPSWLGTGDVTLRNSVLDIRSLENGSAVQFASGAGSVFTYKNMAAVRFGDDDTTAARSKAVTIGAAGAGSGTALVRGGRGSVLYLWNNRSANNGLFDGTGSSLTVNGGVATNANGVTKDPIVVYSSKDNRCHFATCLEDGSIRAYTGYTTVWNDETATSADILHVTSATALAKNKVAHLGGLKLDSSSGTFTVNPGATLYLGNGTDPALVIIDKPHLYGADGVVDFGGSEGVFVGVQESTVVQPTLKGSAEITFTAPPNLTRVDHRYVRVLGNNLHSGGTYVSSIRLSPEKAGAFGVGDVYVGGGHDYGGRIHFNTADLVFTNNFHVAGWGKHDATGADGTSGYGALDFAASTEISGNVELLEETRVSCLTNGDTALISGVVSGDRLQLYNGAGIVVLTGVNTYTGGTEVVASTLKISGGGTLGSGDVRLDGGTLVIDKSEGFVLPNRISGKGTVRIEGKTPVDFAGGFAVDDYGGLVSGNFTLALGSCSRYEVSSLDGVSAITSDSEGAVDLYAQDGGTFGGTCPANVTIHSGAYVPPGLLLKIR